MTLELPEGYTPIDASWKPKNVHAKGLAKLLARMARNDKRWCLIGTAQQTGWVTDRTFLLRATDADKKEIARLAPRPDGRIVNAIEEVTGPARYSPLGEVVGMRPALEPQTWRTMPEASAFLLVRSTQDSYGPQQYVINGDRHHLIMLRYPTAKLRLQPRSESSARPVFYLVGTEVVGAIHPLDD